MSHRVFGSQFRPFLASGLLLTGFVVGFLATPAQAARFRGVNREPQKLSNAQLREAHDVLQATKVMLESADHDYGGHKGRAIQAVAAAEKQLRLALQWQHANKKGAGLGKPVGKAGAKARGAGRQPEPQAISNLQLADAIVILERTNTMLINANHDYGGHRAAAVRDLGAAIKQLKLALKFEKKKT